MTQKKIGRRPHFPDTVVELRPLGRGNWDPVELRLRGRRAPPPLFFVVNARIELAGQHFRVASVRSG